MAQAVAAQALARTGQALDDQDLLAAADQAYAAIPGRLVRALPQGPVDQALQLRRRPGAERPAPDRDLDRRLRARSPGNTGAAGPRRAAPGDGRGAPAEVRHRLLVALLARRRARRRSPTTTTSSSCSGGWRRGRGTRPGATSRRGSSRTRPSRRCVNPSRGVEGRCDRRRRSSSTPTRRTAISTRPRSRFWLSKLVDGDDPRRRHGRSRSSSATGRRRSPGRRACARPGTYYPYADRRRRGREQHEDRRCARS